MGRGPDDKNDCYRLDVYNLTTNQWSTSPITTPHCWFAMTVQSDQMIIAGGKTKKHKITKMMLVLDCGQWKDYNTMPTTRWKFTVVAYEFMLIDLSMTMSKIDGFPQVPLNYWTPLVDLGTFVMTSHHYTTNSRLLL